MRAQGHQHLCCTILLLRVHTCASRPADFLPGHGSMCSVALQTGRYCLLPSTNNGQGAEGLGLQLPGPGLRGIFSHLLEVPRDTELQPPQWELAWKHTFHWLTSPPVSPPYSLATGSWDHCQIIACTPILLGEPGQSNMGFPTHNPPKLPPLPGASSCGLTSNC